MREATPCGLARIAESGFLTKVGLKTFMGGTIHYTEQAVVEGRAKATARTDLYSLGVILFELLVGEPLLWSQADDSYVQKHALLSDGARDLIKRACQLMGRNNFQTVEQFQERLEACVLLPQ